MIFKYSEKTQVLQIDKATGNKLATTQLNEVVELLIEPNGAIEAHALPINVVFYVISGKGSITIDNAVLNAECGDVIEVSADLQRGWLNNGTETLMLLAIKQKL